MNQNYNFVSNKCYLAERFVITKIVRSTVFSYIYEQIKINEKSTQSHNCSLIPSINIMYKLKYIHPQIYILRIAIVSQLSFCELSSCNEQLFSGGLRFLSPHPGKQEMRLRAWMCVSVRLQRVVCGSLRGCGEYFASNRNPGFLRVLWRGTEGEQELAIAVESKRGFIPRSSSICKFGRFLEKIGLYTRKQTQQGYIF